MWCASEIYIWQGNLPFRHPCIGQPTQGNWTWRGDKFSSEVGVWTLAQGESILFLSNFYQFRHKLCRAQFSVVWFNPVISTYWQYCYSLKPEPTTLVSAVRSEWEGHCRGFWPWCSDPWMSKKLYNAVLRTSNRSETCSRFWAKILSSQSHD